MAKSAQTRTIRFQAEDLREAEKFLKRNPIFDFSTLVRTAVRQFIEDPQIHVIGNQNKRNMSRTRRTRESQ
jgi:hypothetical protein